jgi:hypothetical protein
LHSQFQRRRLRLRPAGDVVVGREDDERASGVKKEARCVSKRKKIFRANPQARKIEKQENNRKAEERIEFAKFAFAQSMQRKIKKKLLKRVLKR